MIAVDGLYYRYPNQSDETLRGVTCRFPAGSLTLVSGPTGSAKTTLAFALCGAIPHLLGGRLTGQVLIDGIVVHQQPVREPARRVGFVMQNVQWQTVMDRAADEIAFGLENFAVPADRMDAAIDAAVERVGARNLLHRRLDTLSAGERQRVVLAASLALDQPVLLLDEPLAFLHRTATQQLMQVLGGLRDGGRTVVVFEHRCDVVSPQADRHLTLIEGRVRDGRYQAKELSGCLAGKSPGPCRLVLEAVAYDLPDRRLLHGVSVEVRGETLPVARRKTARIDLPLGATEDRVIGTLNIERALQQGRREFEPGLLATAHRGVLYVDEINLLEDHLVDVLLDSAAMGVNIVQREGIAYAHPARFLLIGTMNPEEGELRPQLLDRFGMRVDVSAARGKLAVRWLDIVTMSLVSI